MYQFLDTTISQAAKTDLPQLSDTEKCQLQKSIDKGMGDLLRKCLTDYAEGRGLKARFRHTEQEGAEWLDSDWNITGWVNAYFVAGIADWLNETAPDGIEDCANTIAGQYQRN